MLATKRAVHKVGLYRFRMEQHSSNNNKENIMQTSHLFSHLIVSVKLFQVMRYRFISLLAMRVEISFDRKFSHNLLFVLLKEKEQTDAPCTIPLCVAFISEMVVCYFTNLVIYLVLAIALTCRYRLL